MAGPAKDIVPGDLRELSKPILPGLTTTFRVVVALSVLPVAGILVYAAATLLDEQCPEPVPHGRIWRTGCGDVWGEGASWTTRIVGAGFSVGAVAWIDSARSRPGEPAIEKHGRAVRWVLAALAFCLALATAVFQWPWWTGVIGLAVPAASLGVSVWRHARKPPSSQPSAGGARES